MKITRRVVGALVAALLTFGAVGMTAQPAQADTGWPRAFVR